MNNHANPHRWMLEVVRGRDMGRRYPLGTGETILGNGLGGAAGIDLADQEVSSTRRMAPRQARIAFQNAAPSIQDLDSPGGTFVNRLRVLPGQARPLQPGDLIQLAGVQLKVVDAPPEAPAATSSAAPTAPGFLYRLGSGAVCRSWDDFLTISAQRWGELREELVSGRLGAFLASIGRTALAPDPAAAGSPDDRLDAWLAALPTTRAATPELSVHPERLELAPLAPGSTTRRALKVQNVGFRLLRVSARVEPADASWIQLDPAWRDRKQAIVEEAELGLELIAPDAAPARLAATIVLEGNGGSLRIPVQTVDRAATEAPVPLAPEGAGPEPPLAGLIAAWTRLGFARRIAATVLALVLLRWVLAIAARLAGTGSDLVGPALSLAVLGGLAGAGLAVRRRSSRDLPAAFVAGLIGGVFLAELLLAGCRVVEFNPRPLTTGGTLSALVRWALIGLVLGALPSLRARTGIHRTPQPAESTP